MPLNMNDLKSRMEGAVTALGKEFSGLRAGRASPDLLEPVMVEAYGSSVPINQVGNVSTLDVRMLSVQVWDKGLVAAVEKAIREANLGLNPAVDGSTIRVSLPEMTEERRQELTKVARKYAENARVSVRNVRRDGMDVLKKSEKEEGLSEDDVHRLGDDIQKLTDSFISRIDEVLAKKEKDIMHV